MKKLLVLLLTLVLILSIAGCANNGEDNDNAGEDQQEDMNDTGDNVDEDGDVDDDAAEGEYQDGTYEGEGDPWDYGMENATVVIEEGEILDVTLRRLNKDGTEVDYENWTGEEKDGKLYPDLKSYKEVMSDRMIEQQTWDVDTISGATTSTENWRLSVKRALEDAKDGNGVD